jgi:hypothetical protein
VGGSPDTLGKGWQGWNVQLSAGCSAGLGQGQGSGKEEGKREKRRRRTRSGLKEKEPAQLAGSGHQGLSCHKARGCLFIYLFGTGC